jgi:hypothetical protein
MTIVVCVRVNDGIVLASDSATTFSDTLTGIAVKVYNHADKIFNLIKGEPIGAMTYGNGSIGNASISTLSKDLRQRLSSCDAADSYSLDLSKYTIQDVARKSAEFFREVYQKEYPTGSQTYFMGYRICGYSTGQPLPEAWEVMIGDNAPPAPVSLYDTSIPAASFGPRWAGETEAIDRLILGTSSKLRDLFQTQGLTPDQAQNAYLGAVGQLKVDLHMAAMPIQDAIDLARFLAETAARFTHFSLRAPTIGGMIELATVTKHEGFKWVSRKHYFSTDLNPREDDRERRPSSAT